WRWRAPESCRSRRGSGCTLHRRRGRGPWPARACPEPWQSMRTALPGGQGRASSGDLQFLGSRAVGLGVGDAEVAVDARGVLRLCLGMPRTRRLALFFRIHRSDRVAVAALARVVFLHARPLANRHLVAVLLVLLLGVDLAGEMPPDLPARLDLADQHRHQLFRDMAVGAFGAHAGAVLVVDGVLELHRGVALIVAGVAAEL